TVLLGQGNRVACLMERGELGNMEMGSIAPGQCRFKCLWPGVACALGQKRTIPILDHNDCQLGTRGGIAIKKSQIERKFFDPCLKRFGQPVRPETRQQSRGTPQTSQMRSGDQGTATWR
ncbi:MAG: hypothetical protein K0R85_557, partial [Devosia sp.]|nr:hypothetical protein [Devosia sp.]